MAPEHDDDSGRYTQTTTPDDVFDVFERVEGPVIISGDVMDALDCSAQTARRKLSTLHEQGRVERRETPRTYLYWRSPGATDESPSDADTRLKRLSTELGEPITVGDSIYESGDKHSVEEGKAQPSG